MDVSVSENSTGPDINVQEKDLLNGNELIQ